MVTNNIEILFVLYPLLFIQGAHSSDSRAAANYPGQEFSRFSQSLSAKAQAVGPNFKYAASTCTPYVMYEVQNVIK